MKGTNPEWYVWEAPSGSVELEGGAVVQVRGGDRLLGVETPNGIVFFEHEPETKH